MSLSTKLIIGGIVATAITAIILYFTKGKGAKATNSTIQNALNSTPPIISEQPAEKAVAHASETITPKTQSNILKNFFDAEGKEVSGVALKQGRAFTQNGSGFSGVMTATTESGKKVKITYSNGFMTKSEINEKLVKTFETFENIPREKAVHITRFTEDGAVKNHHIRFKHDNGKIKRIYTPKGDNLLWSEAVAKDFSEEGILTATAEYKNAGELTHLTIPQNFGCTMEYIADENNTNRITQLQLRKDGSKHIEIKGTTPQLGNMKGNYIQVAGDNFSIANIQQAQEFDGKGRLEYTWRIKENLNGFQFCAGEDVLNPQIDLIIQQVADKPGFQFYTFSPNNTDDMIKLYIGNGEVSIKTFVGNQNKLLKDLCDYLWGTHSRITTYNINYFDKENLLHNIETLEKYIKNSCNSSVG